LSIGAIWDLIILSPMINGLIVLSHYLFDNLGLTIIALTIIIRGLMYPLSLRQMRSTRDMQALQPKLNELQKKYGKQKEKLAAEQQRLYKESGLNPLGCAVPMLIQLPIWIALFQSIVRVLATTPNQFLALSQHLYSSWSAVFSLVPLNSQFLWLDLAVPDKIFLLPLVVGGTMWVQQKMVLPTTGDPQQQARNQMMLWMMPIMFAILTLQFPSGLALYWIVSNIISIAMQYFVTGWGGLVKSPDTKKTTKTKKQKGSRPSAPAISPESAEAAETISVQKEGTDDYGKSGDKRQDSRRSSSTRSGTTGKKPRRSKGNHPKRR